MLNTFIKNNWEILILVLGVCLMFYAYFPKTTPASKEVAVEVIGAAEEPISKTKAISNLRFIPKEFIKSNTEVEIKELEEVRNGVSFYARAWRAGKPIGFMDGTVEWEHFIFYNPPILVPDPTGSIKTAWTVDKTGERREIAYRYDPKTALQIALVDALNSIKPTFSSDKIIKGKKGSTILTFRSAVGQVDPVDGRVLCARDTWTTCHDNADGGSAAPTLNFGNTTINSTAGVLWEIGRIAYTFDTSEIPTTATINSATFDIYTANINDGCLDEGAGEEIDLVQHTLASDADVTTADFDQFGTTEGATQLEVSVLCGSGLNSFNTFTLNATGLTWIGLGTGGRTRLGTRHDDDVDNTDPGVGSYNDNVDHYLADQTGTTNDPFLTVDCSGCGVEEGYQDVQVISRLFLK